MQKHVLTFRAVLMGAAIVASMGVLGLPAFAAKAEVAQTGQTTPYAPGDDGAIQAGVPGPFRALPISETGPLRTGSPG